MKRYTNDHEWIALDGDEAIVGISDFAQNSLGDITFVELPLLGKSFKAGETLAVIESVKAASEIYAPVDGTVVALNEALNDNPALINSAPETQGWICRLAGTAPEQIAALLTPEQYQAQVNS